MELNGAKILYTIHTDIPLLGDFKITQTLVSTWIVMALLSGLAIWLGRNLKLENVSKRQAAAEFIVERLDQFVRDNMGTHFDRYIPLVWMVYRIFAPFSSICYVSPPSSRGPASGSGAGSGSSSTETSTEGPAGARGLYFPVICR